jgi:uncharacterized protein (TIGR02147 family)
MDNEAGKGGCMKKKSASSKELSAPAPVSVPVIFRYHDYRVFLRDWFAYRKASQSRFSLRLLAELAGLATGYLPMILSGKRPLTGKALAKLAPFLGLGESEQAFLENLVVLGTSDSHEARLVALERMRRFQVYQKNNERETEVFRYLTHWYYVTIREMASLPDFRLEPEWIQNRLRVPVPLQEIKEAIEFLTSNGYLETSPDGSVRPPEVALNCEGGVYRVALTQYHHEILDLAAKSIENTPSAERSIQGHTFALSNENLEKAREIVEEALLKVRALGKDEMQGSSVYHLELALFPLTQTVEKKGDKK